MAKVYAVKTGRRPGIYKTWAECEEQTRGFSGAEFKSFSSETEANVYLGQNPKEDFAEGVAKEDSSYIGNYAFTDGSFNSESGIWGYGGFLVSNGEKYTLQGFGSENAESRNICGETAGATAAIEKALRLGLSELTIYYDYLGVEKWATGEWKANSFVAKEYIRNIERAKGAGLSLRFLHVKGHTGIPGNEEADRIAKSACGIER